MALAAVVALTGCADPKAPSGFGVDVTAQTSALPQSVRDDIAGVKLTVSGDKAPFSQTLDIASKLRAGDVRFRYIPGVHSGALTFELDCADGSGMPIASASSRPVTLIDGKAVSLTLPLMASAAASNDMGSVTGDMNGAGDAGPGGDMAPGSVAQGAVCTANAQCATGICADGHCCDTACAGTCVACDLPGSLGTCTPVAAGSSPDSSHGSCAAQPMSSCGNDGTCDGKGACRSWVLNTVCAASTCDSGSNSFTPARTCDGKGTCQATNAISCAPYLCADATKCESTCSGNSNCSSGNVCSAGSCGLKGAGQTCGGNSECSSGFCVDSVCCNSACGGKCETCNQATALGTCTPVPLGQDPRGMCPAGSGNDANCTPGGCDGNNVNGCLLSPANTACGGSCNGSIPIDAKCDSLGKCSQTAPQNQCALCNTCTASATTASCIVAPNTTVCTPGYCSTTSNNTAYAPAYCNNGVCPSTTAAINCGLYICSGGSCLTDCGDCMNPYCNANPTDPSCLPNNSDCVSGVCDSTCVKAFLSPVQPEAVMYHYYCD